MIEKPILFNGEMVRAVLDGRKTQTRRVVKGIALDWMNNGFSSVFTCSPKNELSPYGFPGDLLWVRETWAVPSLLDSDPPSRFYKWGVWFRADGTYATRETHGGAFGTPYPSGARGKWRPSIFMPRWASRITLEVTAVRIERLQDISVSDMRAEGIKYGPHDPGEFSIQRTVREFRDLWDSINAKRGYGWDVNPWVWVVEFKHIASLITCTPSLDSVK